MRPQTRNHADTRAPPPLQRHKEEKHKKHKKEKKEKHSSRKRSRSRSRSRSSDSSSDSGRGGAAAADDAPPSPSFAITPISATEDYFLKNHEFSAWLRATRGVFFTALKADEARALFVTFAAEWNARRLPRRLYQGVQVTGRR